MDGDDAKGKPQETVEEAMDLYTTDELFRHCDQGSGDDPSFFSDKRPDQVDPLKWRNNHDGVVGPPGPGPDEAEAMTTANDETEVEAELGVSDEVEEIIATDDTGSANHSITDISEHGDSEEVDDVVVATDDAGPVNESVAGASVTGDTESAYNPKDKTEPQPGPLICTPLIVVEAALDSL